MELPRRRSRLVRVEPLLCLAALALAAGAAAYAVRVHRAPEAVGSEAEATEFSAARAMVDLRRLAARPRPIGSEANREAVDFLLGRLRELGLEAEVQRTTVVRGSRVAEVENVVGRLRGRGGPRAILLVAHLDTVPMSPGAGDAASGVAAILETVRAIASGPALANDLLILFSNPEEIYLHGGKGFVDEHRWLADVGLVVNFDPGGTTGPAYVHETGPDNGWWIAELAEAVPHPVGTSLAFAVKKLQGDRSDEFHLFTEAGIPGFNIGFTGGDARYHSALDRPENLDPRSLQHLGSYALGIVRHFGALDLAPRPAPDAVFFNTLGTRFVHYPPAWRYLPALVATLLFALVLAAGRRTGKLGLTGVGKGAALWLGALACSLFVVLAAHRAVGASEAVATVFLTGDVYYGERYLLGFVCLAAAATALCYGLARRRVTLYEAAAGALAVFWLLMAASVVALQEASYFPTWTLVFALAGLLVVVHGSAGWGLRTLDALTLTLAALPGIVLAAPSVPVVFTVLSFDEAPWLMAVVVLLLGLLAPLVRGVATGSLWALPALAGVAGIGCLVWGLSGPLDARHPRTSFVTYGLDATEERALWLSRSRARRPALPDEWTRQFFSGETERGEVPEIYPWSSTVFLRGAAPVLPLQPPEAELVQEMEAGGTRTLSLRIRSPRGAPLMAVVVEAGVDSWSTGGRGIPGRQLVLYHNVPAHGFELTLTVGLDEPLEMALIDASYGLPAPPGASIRPRPLHYMPEPSGGSVFTDATLVRTDLVF